MTILALGFLSVLLLTLGSDSTAEFTPVPAAVASRAVAEFESEYGSVERSFGATSASLREWMRLEPSNTSGLAAQDLSSDRSIYVLFVEGKFLIQGPPLSKGGYASIPASTGRLVFDEGGELLSVQLWSGSRSTDPPIGPAFDDR